MNTSNTINGCLKCHKTNSRLILATLLVLLAGGSGLSVRGQQPVTLAASHFDNTNRADGWLGTNDANGSETLSYNSGDATSNSIGYISVSETSGDGHSMFLAAPAKFLGDKHAAYNGFLKFQLKQSATQGGRADHFVILGTSNVLLSFAWEGVPPTNWTFFEVPLNENMGWFNITSNRFATRVDIINVLTALNRLWILGEYSSHNFDQTDLDEVELLGQPSGPIQPTLAAATYAGITLNAQVGASYRIEYQDTLGGSTNWLKLADIVVPYAPYVFIDQTSPGVSSRFYRAALNP